MLNFRQKYSRAGEVIIALSLTAAAISTSCAQQTFDHLLIVDSGVNRGINVSPIVGAAHIVDGDSLAVTGQAIRLEGIDAPELRQTCERNGATSQCGVEATAMLRSIIRERSVSCAPVGKDRYGRTLGICHAGSDEMNSLMVRSGHALAFVKYSPPGIRPCTSA